MALSAKHWFINKDFCLKKESSGEKQKGLLTLSINFFNKNIFSLFFPPQINCSIILKCNIFWLCQTLSLHVPSGMSRAKMVMGRLPQQTPTWLSKGFPLINPPQSSSAQRGIYCNPGRTPQRGLQDLGCATQHWIFTLNIPDTGLVPWRLCLARCIRNLK